MFESLNEQDRQEWNMYIEKLFSQEQAFDIPVKQVQLKTRLDLHGMTVSHAHGQVLSFIEDHVEAKTASVVIITGKSGQIAHEFHEWCELSPKVRRIEPIIDSRGQIGSYRLWLKTQKK